MNCTAARERLLLEADPSPRSLPPELAAHLAGCEPCLQFASELARLEDDWRSIPLPARAETARDEFLERLPRLKARAPRPMAPRWLIAASILIGLGVVGGLLVSVPRAKASVDVVEHLVDWNLKLTEVSSIDERNRIYAGEANRLTDELKTATLPDEDRVLAESLLETAPWLVRNANPLAEADRFNDVADKLLARMNRAARRGDARRAAQTARLYSRVADLGIESKLDILEHSEALDFEGQRRLERVILQDENRMRDLIALLERAPDSSRKEIKRALGIVPKAGGKDPKVRLEKRNARKMRNKDRGQRTTRPKTANDGR